MNRDLLAAYLFEQGSLPLAGIGALYVETKPPAYDVTTNAVSAPQYQLTFSDTERDASAQSLMRYCARATGLMEDEVYEEYAADMQNIRDSITQPDGYYWQGIGHFSFADVINFTPDDTAYLQASAVEASRILASQKVMENLTSLPGSTEAVKDEVNEPEKFETREYPWENESDNRSLRRWWIGAAALFVIAVTLIALRLGGFW